MIQGIGVDIVRTSRFGELIKRHPLRLNRLCERILHPEERECIQSLSLLQLQQHLASAWAAKEAVYKSLPIDEQKQCIFSHWRKIRCGGRFEMKSDLHRSDTLLLSLSHDGDYTIAMVTRTQHL